MPMLFVVCSVGSGFCDRLVTRAEERYWICVYVCVRVRACVSVCVRVCESVCE